jgi:HEPN domain-containing protein
MQEANTSKDKLVKIWLEKAKTDLSTAIKIAKPPEPYYDTAVYHCQQSAEKCFKGFMVFENIKFEKTHDLKLLLEMILDVDQDFSSLSNYVNILNPYSTLYRYPGEITDPTKEEYGEAFDATKRIYNFIISKLKNKITFQISLFD